MSKSKLLLELLQQSRLADPRFTDDSRQMRAAPLLDALDETVQWASSAVRPTSGERVGWATNSAGVREATGASASHACTGWALPFSVRGCSSALYSIASRVAL